MGLALPTSVGITLTSIFLAALQKTEEQGGNKMRKYLHYHPTSTSNECRICVYTLKSGYILPYNIHLHRNIQWEDTSTAPAGHHSLSCTFGNEIGECFVERLRQVDFGTPIASLTYQLHTLEGILKLV